MTENEFRYVEKAVKYTMITGLWSLVGLAVTGAYHLATLVF